MNYASVCDGIGAAHVAWRPLGWQCSWTSEIEPFPAAVVDHHFGFANVGDMTKITEEMLHEHGPVELLVGGTPCQSFSVAGLRGGLADPRGNLALRFVQLASVMQPKWIVWENVPGVLSSGKGRDFGTFLGALGEIGYGFAYRVLDAQWFGVAQRRRRVFVIGHLGDWRRAAAVLFERESVFGNPPTRGATGQGTASRAQGSTDTCGTLCADKHSGAYSGQDAYTGRLMPVAFGGQMSTPQVDIDLSQTLQRKNPQAVAFTAKDCGGDASQDVAPTMRAMGHSGSHANGGGQLAVAFTKSKRAQSTTDDESWVPGEVSPTMRCFDQGDTRASTTTVVAVDLQNVQVGGDLAGTLDTTRPSRGGGQAVATPIDIRQSARGDKDTNDRLDGGPPGTGLGGEGDPAFTVSERGQAVAQGFTYSGYSNQPAWMTGDRTDCLPASGHSDGIHQGVGVVSVRTAQTSANGHGVAVDVAHTLDRAQGQAVAAMAVRRLTPRECERLQGFPDDYTLVEYRKKPAADGPRYRALGNSMAVPVMRWIGERIKMVDELRSSP